RRGLGPRLCREHAGHVPARQGRPRCAACLAWRHRRRWLDVGTNPHANLGAYGPSKAAVIMLAQVLAQEFGRDGIRVNTVSPGMVRTGMTAKVYADDRIAAERDALVPLGRVAAPEDMADVIAFLLRPDARYINGHDLVVDGGVAGNFLGRLPGLSQITRG